MAWEPIALFIHSFEQTNAKAHIDAVECFFNIQNEASKFTHELELKVNMYK